MTFSNNSFFLLLVISQTLHSLEEYFFKLWEVFLPARVVSGLFSNNLPLGFGIVNISVVLLGFWCYFFPVKNAWNNAIIIMWIWALIELGNGIGHSIFSLQQGGYFPGVITAVPLLVFSCLLISRLVKPDKPTV